MKVFHLQFAFDAVIYNQKYNESAHKYYDFT